MKPVRIQFDTEFEDDGLFSITFWFDKSSVPSYISLARDEMEDPDFVYVEAEDQKYGFKATDLSFLVEGNTIRLQFDLNSSSYFYWDKSKELSIEVSVNELPEVERYLENICK